MTEFKEETKPASLVVNEHGSGIGSEPVPHLESIPNKELTSLAQVNLESASRLEKNMQLLAEDIDSLAKENRVHWLSVNEAVLKLHNKIGGEKKFGAVNAISIFVLVALLTIIPINCLKNFGDILPKLVSTNSKEEQPKTENENQTNLEVADEAYPHPGDQFSCTGGPAVQLVHTFAGTPESAGIHYADNLVKSLFPEKTDQTDPQFEIPCDKIPYAFQENSIPVNHQAQTLDFARGIYQSLLTKELPRTARRDILRSLFAVNYWLHDYDGATKYIEKLEDDDKDRDDYNRSESLANIYRKALVLSASKKNKDAEKALEEGIDLGKQFEGKAGGLFTDLFAEFYTRLLTKQHKLEDAKRFVKELKEFRQPYYRESDHLTLFLTMIIDGKTE